MKATHSPEEVAVEQVLKPCPFCGKEQAKTHAIRDGFEVICGCCRASGPACYRSRAYPPSPEKLSMAAWNHRIEASHASGAMRKALELADSALQRAHVTFDRYAKLHYAKGTEEGSQKALANAAERDALDPAINAVFEALATPAPDTAGLRAEELMADALSWADRDHCLSWIEDVKAGKFNRAGSRVDLTVALTAIEAAIRKLAASPGEGRGEVVCRHEPYQGKCAHCDVPFRDGKPVTPSASTGQDLREALKKIAHTAYGYECRNIARAALASTGISIHAPKGDRP